MVTSCTGAKCVWTYRARRLPVGGDMHRVIGHRTAELQLETTHEKVLVGLAALCGSLRRSFVSSPGFDGTTDRVDTRFPKQNGYIEEA